MNLRRKERIDYAIYQNKGLKVPKEVTVEHTVEMADELVRREKGLREDLEVNRVSCNSRLYCIGHCIAAATLAHESYYLRYMH